MLVSSSALHAFDGLAFVSGLCSLSPSSLLAKCCLHDFLWSRSGWSCEALEIGSVQVLTSQMEGEKSFSLQRRWGSSSRAGGSCTVCGSVRSSERGLCLLLCLHLLRGELVGKSIPHSPELLRPEISVIPFATVLCCVHAWWHCDLVFCHY